MATLDDAVDGHRELDLSGEIFRILDSKDVPRLVVDYVMFHEMLHLRHPVEHAGARRCIHTPAFKQEEKRFVGAREAKAWLRGLA